MPVWANVPFMPGTMGKAAFRVPERWSCCGAPLEKVGDAERLRMVREENLRFFDGFERLVTSCPGCYMQLTYGIKKHGLKTKSMQLVELLDLAYRPASKH